jgi:hypothetical protein
VSCTCDSLIGITSSALLHEATDDRPCADNAETPDQIQRHCWSFSEITPRRRPKTVPGHRLAGHEAPSHFAQGGPCKANFIIQCPEMDAEMLGALEHRKFVT